jgi:hypothetical protein
MDRALTKGEVAVIVAKRLNGSTWSRIAADILGNYREGQWLRRRTKLALFPESHKGRGRVRATDRAKYLRADRAVQ